jgi:hypothetical protein
MSNRISSFQQDLDLLWLRVSGCPVQYAHDFTAGRALRMELRSTYLETNLYPVEDGTVVAFWLDVRAAAALTVHQFRFWAPWAAGPISWLQPSTKHLNHYCLPPGIWIPSSRVLNHRRDDWGQLRRNQHREGFLLGIIQQALPTSAGEHLEAVVAIEDLRGYNHPLIVSLINRPLDPRLRRTRGEQATFSPAAQEEIRTVNPKVLPTVIDKTETWQWKAVEKELHALAASADAMGDRDRWGKDY